jgi:hypothetical protein
LVLGFGIWGFDFWALGVGCVELGVDVGGRLGVCDDEKVPDSRFKFQGSASRLQDLGCRHQDLGFRIQDLGCGV